MAKDADQAEFNAVKHGSTVVDSGIDDDKMAGAMDDFEIQESAPTARWIQDAVSYEGAAATLHDVVQRRAELMDRTYPFRYDQGTLIYEQSNNLVYEFLLAICNARSITQGAFVEFPRFFERLSAKLIAAYFGPDTQSIHTGFPRDPEIGRSFRDAMATVADRTGEWKWGPNEDLCDEPIHGDSGCDFVVWPPAADGRQIGQLFILGQCACGNNWPDKFEDLSIGEVGKWFNPLSDVKPVRSFATPFYVTDEMLPTASRRAGIVFDRVRLVSISNSASNEVIDEAMREKMSGLIRLAC